MPTTPSDSPAPANPPSWTPPRVYLLVAIYAALVFLPFLGARVLTRHEVMVTQPALRILSDGEWIVPRYASGFWLDKPPLLNWVTAGVFAVTGGFSEWAARLPAALSAIGLCVLVAWLALRQWGPLAGLLAGLVQASCVWVFIQGRLGEIDMPFALLIAGAHVPLLLRWGTGRLDLPWRFAVAFYALAGLAVLAKGLLAVGLLGASVLAFCVLQRSLRPLRAVLLTPAVLVFLAIAVPWHVAAIQVTGGEARVEWSYNSLWRFAGRHHLGAASPVYYFYMVPFLTLPWAVWLLIDARRLWQAARRPETHATRVLSAWFLGGFTLLSLSAFKHQHYIMPVLPPLAVLAGEVLAVHVAQLGRRARHLYVPLFAGLLIAFLIVGGIVMPRRDHRRPMVDYVRGTVATLPADTPLYVVGLAQSAAYPYVNRPSIYIDSIEDVLATLDKLGDEPMWVLTLQTHRDLAAEHGLTLADECPEPPRKKLKEGEALTFGRIVRTTPTTQP